MPELKPIATKPTSETGSKTTFTLKSKDSEKKELVEEYKRLVGILESESHKDDKEEAKLQAKELKELKEGKEYKPAKADIKKSIDRANDLIKTMKESLSEEEMDLKKKFKSKKQQKYMYAAAERGDIPKKVVEEFSEKTKDFSKLPETKKSFAHIEHITKALKSSAILGLSRRVRLDVVYRAGIAAAECSPRLYTELVDLSGKLDIGITEKQTRPDYEPPVVPVRKVETPFHISPKECGDHEYKTPKVDSEEAKPFWRR